ncbi:DNA-processing protein DprA [Jatrophihabitans sp.]|uniref:DNA-processing protein DprA n=1 Tax=Jatrophihabitans sp. TaxID=1932789 RepID=UPI002BF1E483|nr:DNA-processing protein DprA [Jatrophihabitans sp.]
MAESADQAPGEEHLLAAAYLSRVAEPASVPLWLFVQQHGYLTSAAAVRAGNVPAEVASCTEARRTAADPHVDLAVAERTGIRLLTPAHPDWPHFAFAALQVTGLRRAAQWRAGLRARPPRGELIPPLALWVRGNAPLATVGVRSVAVVGSRAATAYGEHVASEFSYGLARHEVVVVSGGAYGIDAAAHRGALAAEGCSVLVSAGGLDRPYPAGHRHLYDRTAEHGLLVSERPPGSAPHRQRFLSRNRLIAALGTATLVVEAASRSGALNSAGYARDLGRPVLAVPGPVTSAMSAGCHALVQRDEEPARLVTSVAEVLSYCGGGQQVGGSEDAAAGGEARSRSYDGLDLVARSVLDGFPGRGRSVTEAELSRLSGQPITQVIAALPVLREAGLIAVAREGYRLANPAR